MDNQKLEQKIYSHITTGRYNFNDMSIYEKSKVLISIIERNKKDLTKNTKELKIAPPSKLRKEKVIKNYKTGLMFELSLFSWTHVLGGDINIDKFYNSLVVLCDAIDTLNSMEKMKQND